MHGLARDGATMFPQAIALAATWDTALMSRVAAAIARRRAAAASARCSRRWSTSPTTSAGDAWRRRTAKIRYLSSAMARAFVGAFEHAGVVTTPKHFVANVGEGGRDSYPIDFDERLLDELYFPPFHARDPRRARAVGDERVQLRRRIAGDAEPRAAHGHAASATGAFTGFVISDAAATGGATVLHIPRRTPRPRRPTRSTPGSTSSSSRRGEQHRPYLDAFQRGLIPDSVIDAAVARVLRVKFELGLFEHPYVDAGQRRGWERQRGAPRARARGGARVDRAAQERRRRAAAREDDALDRRDRRRRRRSAARRLQRARQPQGLDPRRDRAALASGSDGVVRYAPGPGRIARDYVVVPADAALVRRQRPHRARTARRVLRQQPPRGRAAAHAHRRARGFRLDAQLARARHSVRLVLGAVDGHAHVPPSGVRRIGVEGNDGYRLYLDGKLLIDDWQKRSYGIAPRRREARAGQLARDPPRVLREHRQRAREARLGRRRSRRLARRDRLAVAVARARRDVAVVVAGLEEGEFRDRALLGLPGQQEELIERVAATGKPTVVVLVGGSAITMLAGSTASPR